MVVQECKECKQDKNINDYAYDGRCSDCHERLRNMQQITKEEKFWHDSQITKEEKFWHDSEVLKEKQRELSKWFRENSVYLINCISIRLSAAGIQNTTGLHGSYEPSVKNNETGYVLRICESGVAVSHEKDGEYANLLTIKDAEKLFIKEVKAALLIRKSVCTTCHGTGSSVGPA